MVGIDMGATTITLSTGVTLPFLQDDVPRDLLQRIADNRPYVWIGEHGCELRSAHSMYANAIAEALREGQPGGDAEAPSTAAPSTAAPIAVAVPSWWAPRTLARIHTALAEAGINAVLVNEAEAAVTEWRTSGHEVPDYVAVLSLRAEHVSVAIVRSYNGRPQALLSPTLVHDAGGVALDSAVLQHLVRGLGDLGETIDIHDPHTISAAQDALTQCTSLREALSAAATESVLLALPGAAHPIRVVRSEIEEIATPWADAVLRMLSTAIEQSDLQVRAVLITGGLAAMPLISQRISADLALDVLMPSEPTLVVARGAEAVAAEPTKPARNRWSFAWRALRSTRTRARSGANTGTKGGANGARTSGFATNAAADHKAPLQHDVIRRHSDIEALLSALQHDGALQHDDALQVGNEHREPHPDSAENLVRQ